MRGIHYQLCGSVQVRMRARLLERSRQERRANFRGRPLRVERIHIRWIRCLSMRLGMDAIVERLQIAITSFAFFFSSLFENGTISLSLIT